MFFLQGTFSSSLAVFLSMLGAVVGTGNIWRFPRIVANHSTEGGKSCTVGLRVVGNWRDLLMCPHV